MIQNCLRATPTILLLVLLFVSCNPNKDSRGTQPAIYEFNPDAITRWSSPENLNGSPGMGGKENNGAKGHAFDSIAPGQTRALVDVTGTGRITRMWITVIDRSPEMLRSLSATAYFYLNVPSSNLPFVQPVAYRTTKL